MSLTKREIRWIDRKATIFVGMGETKPTEPLVGR